MATKIEIEKVWLKGQVIFGKNENLWRKDDCGNLIYKPAYGKFGKYGWEIDHAKPKKRKGSDSLKNKRPLQTKENRKKSVKYPYNCK